MNIREIAEQLSKDLVESPNDKPIKVQSGREMSFVQRTLGIWGYKIPAKRMRELAARSESYDGFMRSATTFKSPSA